MKNLLKSLTLLLALALPLPCAQAQTTISALPAATTLSGAELLAGVQGGTTKKITAAQVATLSTGPGEIWTGTPIGVAFGGFGVNNSASSGVPLFSSGSIAFTATSGTGTFARTNAPTFIAPTLGAALATSINGTLISTTAGDTAVLLVAIQTLTNKSISGSANTLTNIGNASLTNSAITLCGTSTSLGGSLTASACLDSLGSTRGSILYRGASGWAALTPGTSGAYLQSSGAGADPLWAATNRVTIGTSTFATSSAAAVHAGYGSSLFLTPTTSRVRLTLTQYSQSVSAQDLTLQIRYGTGTAPVQGAACTGTNPSGGSIVASHGPPTFINDSFSFDVIGLTPSTTYWFDECVTASGGGATNLFMRQGIVEQVQP